MVLTLLAVLPVLAVLLVMALQPLLEAWDDRASERAAAGRGAGVGTGVDTGDLRVPELPASAASMSPTAFPEALGDVSAVLSIPHPRRPVPSLHPVR